MGGEGAHYLLSLLQCSTSSGLGRTRQDVPALVSRLFLLVIVSPFLGLALSSGSCQRRPPTLRPPTASPAPQPSSGFSRRRVQLLERSNPSDVNRHCPREPRPKPPPANRNSRLCSSAVQSQAGCELRAPRPCRGSAGGLAGASAFSEQRRAASGSADCVPRCGRRRFCALGVLNEVEATRPGRKVPQTPSGQARRGSQD